jgi:hypothetical protein
MENKNEDGAYLKGTRFSLGLKLIIIAWSFYIAVKSETLSVSIFYLVVSILFTGLFIFQLDYYNKKKRKEQ